MQRASQEEQNVDLNMGKAIYLLQMQGFPVNICGNLHHLKVDKGKNAKAQEHYIDSNDPRLSLDIHSWARIYPVHNQLVSAVCQAICEYCE